METNIKEGQEVLDIQKNYLLNFYHESLVMIKLDLF